MVFNNLINRGRELIAEAQLAGITLRIADGQVRMQRPSTVSPDLLGRLRAERDAVVAALAPKPEPWDPADVAKVARFFGARPMEPVARPEPSKRAKSQAALDLVHGRKGGRNAHQLTDFEAAEALKAAVASGTVVRARCMCTWWWIARRDRGKACLACRLPMVAA